MFAHFGGIPVVASVGLEAYVLVGAAATLLMLTCAKFVLKDALDLRELWRTGGNRSNRGRGDRRRPLLRGVPLAPGEITGRLAFDSAAAAREKNQNHTQVVIVCGIDDPDHSLVLALADAIILIGFRTDSPVVAQVRQKGIPAICNIACDQIDRPARAIHVNGHILREGQTIRINGDDGFVSAV